MLSECACAIPNPRLGREDWCVQCGRAIPKRWTCNSQTIDAWLRRLAAALPGENLAKFREHIIVRELAGRDRFKHSFLGRDNLAEGLEEATDLALYSLLDTLKAVREGHGDEDVDLALTASAHAFHAYKALDHLRQKRQGAP